MRLAIHRSATGWTVLVLLTLTWSGIAAGGVAGAELDSLLKTIRDVQVDGQGNRQAAQAWQQLVTTEADQLPRILAALDGSGPLAANWLRAAVDAIAERQLAGGGDLPKGALEQFALDTRHDPRGRRLAFEWLARVDATARDRLIPGMLHDPSVEFRRDAVARLLDRAENQLQADRQDQARQLLLQALDGARDEDQIKRIAERLSKLGQNVDLPRHFGFLMNWKVIGPFDNSDRKGFDVVYPPENELDDKASYVGKDGPVQWTSYTTSHDYGMVDLNQPYGKLKETVGYAWTQFTSDQQQQVELRLGCKNAWKLWLNGELIFERDEYHRGMRLDQYQLPVTLKKGRNDILLKVCQNEQQESWTVEWQFQLRVCDSTGTAILSTTRK